MDGVLGTWAVVVCECCDGGGECFGWWSARAGVMYVEYASVDGCVDSDPCGVVGFGRWADFRGGP